MKIDRAIPPLDYGKGCEKLLALYIICVWVSPVTALSDRVGSEFWSQTVPIGDAETGIKWVLCIHVYVTHLQHTTLQFSSAQHHIEL